MFRGNVVNLFIGLALTFGAIGLAASGMTERIALIPKRRAANRLTGAQDIPNDSANLTGLPGAVLAHGGVKPQSKAAPADLTGGFAALTEPQRGRLFKGMWARAGTATSVFRGNLADRFDNTMDRIGSAYKRRTQMTSRFIGSALAVKMDVESRAIARTRCSNRRLTMSPTGPNLTDVATAINKGNQAGFPFGWSQESPAVAAAPETTPEGPCVGPQGGNGAMPGGGDAWLAKSLGWALTASAPLFSASLSFDLPQRFVRRRGIGTAPSEQPAFLAQHGA